MITVEARTTIRYLHAQGKSIRAIAKELGLARNTVRSALRREGSPAYARPKRSNPQLAPFLAQIEEMLVKKRFIGSRILREVRMLGYEGGRTALYDHLRTLRERVVDPRVTERFETPPAHQGQFDWSPYTISLGGQVVKVTLFCLTLCFSRRKFYWPSLDATQESVFEALEKGLEHFGGSPKRVLLDSAVHCRTPGPSSTMPVPNTFAGTSAFCNCVVTTASSRTPAIPGDHAPKARSIRPRQRTADSTTWSSISSRVGRGMTLVISDVL